MNERLPPWRKNASEEREAGMRRTLIVINDMSGNSERADVNAIRFACAKNDYVEELRLCSPDQDYDVTGFDKLIVCGGDGTINNAVNKCKEKNIDIFYFPFGTLNEKANTNSSEGIKKVERLKAMGMANRDLFSYVIAAGSFTEIGYSAASSAKKRFKALAYVAKVLSAYKVFRMEAEVVTERETYYGNYTLIMVIDSNRCFGFDFNKAYKPDDKYMYLLTIKSPKRNGLLGKVSMFFPFFRTFFMGFKKEYHSKRINFLPVRNVEVNLRETQVFCVDGERREYDGFLHVEKLDIKPRLFIMRLL